MKRQTITAILQNFLKVLSKRTAKLFSKCLKIKFLVQPKLELPIFIQKKTMLFNKMKFVQPYDTKYYFSLYLGEFPLLKVSLL